MNDLSPENFGKHLCSRLGTIYEYHPVLGSTNAFLADKSRQGAPEGTLVVAGIQTSGRGRLDRIWESPMGGLWASLLLKPQRPSGLLPLAAGISVASALRDFGVASCLKWPNDVIVNEKKIAGILCENIHGDVVVGIGLNANVPSDVLDSNLSATTILAEVGKEVDRSELLSRILFKLEELYSFHETGRGENIVEIWRELSATLDKEVLVKTMEGEIKGLARDILSDGSLVVVDSSGKQNIIVSGDCIHLRQQE